MKNFKLFISVLITVMMLLAMTIVSFAEAPPSGSTEWEDVMQGASFETDDVSVTLRGSGYEADPRFKFGFRNTVALNVNDASATILFPNTFVDFDDASGHTYYIVSFTNAPVNWIDRVASVNFIIYPLSNSQFNVCVTSNTDSGWGDGTISNNKVFDIPSNRKMTFAIKKSGSNYTTYVNGQEFDKLNEKTLATINKYTNGEAFLMLGAVDEKDKNGEKEMSVNLTDVTGLTSSEATNPPSSTSDATKAANSSSTPVSSSIAASAGNTSSKTSSSKSPSKSSTPGVNASGSNKSDNSGKSDKGNNTLLFVLIGVVVVCLGGAATAFIIYKRKAK